MKTLRSNVNSLMKTLSFVGMVAAMTAFAPSTHAFEVIDAKVLCDRFVGGGERDQCLALIQKTKPDTYVSSVCHYLFDDKLFKDCLSLASKLRLNPREVAQCGAADLEDQARMTCLQARRGRSPAFQSGRTVTTPQRATSEAASSGKAKYLESKAGR